jgi:proteic killer suppression protein
MIRNFRHKGLEKLYEKGETSLLRQDQLKRANRALSLLDSAKTIEEMRIPGYRLHSLTGDLKGYWSITVSGNWRIIFRFENGDAHDVELIDYH